MAAVPSVWVLGLMFPSQLWLLFVNVACSLSDVTLSFMKYLKKLPDFLFRLGPNPSEWLQPGAGFPGLRKWDLAIGKVPVPCRPRKSSWRGHPARRLMTAAATTVIICTVSTKCRRLWVISFRLCPPPEEGTLLTPHFQNEMICAQKV